MFKQRLCLLSALLVATFLVACGSSDNGISKTNEATEVDVDRHTLVVDYQGKTLKAEYIFVHEDDEDDTIDINASFNDASDLRGVSITLDEMKKGSYTVHRCDWDGSDVVLYADLEGIMESPESTKSCSGSITITNDEIIGNFSSVSFEGGLTLKNLQFRADRENGSNDDAGDDSSSADVTLSATHEGVDYIDQNREAYIDKGWGDTYFTASSRFEYNIGEAGLVSIDIDGFIEGSVSGQHTISSCNDDVFSVDLVLSVEGGDYVYLESTASCSGTITIDGDEITGEFAYISFKEIEGSREATLSDLFFEIIRW